MKKNGVQAIIGSWHQVLKNKRNILFYTVPNAPCLTLVGGESELKYVDEPIDKSGLMRLATFHNYAYHMGNQVESWMKDLLSSENFKESKYLDVVSTEEKKKTINHRVYIIRKHFFKTLFKIFYSKWERKH